ncbi:MAG: cytochrome c maturation protein CcmE [Flavobacteriales bacterium]
MKRNEIIIILIVAVVLVGIIAAYNASSSKSATFTDAKNEIGVKYKIVGTFDKSQGVERHPEVDANLTIFSMVDETGKTERVMLHDEQGEPMGLKQSESVTIEGKYNELGEFHADFILMKCPSKYDKNKHGIGTESAQAK